MDITKAKEFLEKQGLDDCHYQDSGMIEHIAEQMEMYHVEQLRIGICAVSSSLPPDVAEKILKARDAFVEQDYDEVWHWLYSIASPNYDKTEPWEDLERMARRSEQLPSCDKCGYYIHPENKTCLREGCENY